MDVGTAVGMTGTVGRYVGTFEGISVGVIVGLWVGVSVGRAVVTAGWCVVGLNVG